MSRFALARTSGFRFARIGVEADSKWLISKRCISSDSGTPDRFDQTFKQRDNPLPPL